MSLSIAGSSMIFDAASCAAWKLPAVAGEASSEGRKKLSFKRRKARGILDDDPLEDTASSPVNSPKISDTNNLKLNQRKIDENRHAFYKERDVGFENCEEVSKVETEELGSSEAEHKCTELKKKGLCLVPLSMLVNYLK